MRPELITADGIRRQILDDDTAIVEYALGEERSYVWALTREGLISAELPARASVEASARKAYNELSANDSRKSSEPVQALSRLILAPISASLKKKRLVVVAEGALQYIPFGALPEASGQPLIIRHEIAGLPSVSTLSLWRREASVRPTAAKPLIVFGDPVFDAADSRVNRSVQTQLHREPDLLDRSAAESGVGHFERLRSTRLEAESIVALAGQAGARKALDINASSQLATGGELGDYRIVHIATHALLNNQHPELSGLVFSLVDPAGRPIDGFLRAYEVYNLRLQADLVVLSACQTALGEDVRGEGLMGLTRGFMYAGAPRVVASLWRVPDRGTAELMKRFYEGMLVKGLRPAAALRAAQLAMRKEPRWNAPYNWAGFTLQGEWN
jgi:CHAT domain-containing protein